jgi:hypothetical protein
LFNRVPDTRPKIRITTEMNLKATGMPRAALRVTIRVLPVGLFFLTLMPWVSHFTDVQARLRKVPVGSRIPSIFPVLVVSGGDKPGDYRAKVVYHEDLQEYLKTLPSYSYLVPEGQEKSLNRYLKDSLHGKAWTFDDQQGWMDPGWFSAKTLPGGRQLLEVHRSFDDDRVNVGWYIADVKSFRPTYYQFYFGPRLVLRAFPQSLLANGILWVVLYGVYWWIRRTRVRQSALLRLKPDEPPLE